MPAIPARQPAETTTITVNQADYACNPGTGLAPEAVLGLDAFIYREAHRMLHSFPNRGLELDDLVQDGRIGALKAARRFNPAYNVKFITYAAFSINAAMRETVAGGLIHTSRGSNRPQVISMDAPSEEGEGWNQEEFSRPDQTDMLTEVARQDMLDRAMAEIRQLPEVRTQILLRYAQDEPLADIAKDLGVSRQRVSQILKASSARIRASLAA